MKTATKPHGMIFAGESVRAFLDGRKTQTRRLVKPQPVCENGYWTTVKMLHHIGSVVYAKESFIIGTERCDSRFHKGEENRVWYRESNEGRSLRWLADCGEEWLDKVPWKSPLHMPRWAARLWFRVTDVRVQRLQDISEEDAKAEGIGSEYVCWGKFHGRRKYIAPGIRHINCYGHVDYYAPAYNTAVEAYRVLWDHINPKTPWESNPWVFCYTFERIDKPEGI